MRAMLMRLLYKATKPQLLTYLAELEQLQWRSLEEIEALQQQHLYEILQYAQQYVPYYRDLFAKIGFQAEDYRHDPASLGQIPYLTKRLIQENYERLLSTEPGRLDNITRLKTGGTTGEPTWFTQDETYRDYNTAHDYHLASWSGWQLGQPQIWLWGHHEPDTPEGAVSMGVSGMKNWLLNRFDSNAFVMTSESMEQLAAKMAAHPGGVIWGYVSSIYKLAQYLADKPHGIRLQAIYPAAEPMFDYQRQVMSEVFGCPVFHWYASNDVGDIASECEQHDGLHVTTRNIYIEVEQDGQPVPGGEEGEFILTNLINRAMPIIRYQIEDWGRQSSRRCPCGRGLPLLEVVEGRTIDMFKTRDGRFVHGMFAKDLMQPLETVRQFQVVQKSLDLVVFKIVSREPVDSQKLQKVEQISKNILGDNVTVQFDFVDELPTSPTGKHRYLVSEVT